MRKSSCQKSPKNGQSINNKINIMNITKNFTLTELTTSREALRSQIGNKPTPVALINLVKLSIYLLQPLRTALRLPITINSAYRSNELNTLVGGVPTSQHLKGEAADITCTNNNAILNTVISLGLPFDQMIIYPTFVHLSFSDGKNRNQIIYNNK